MDKLNGPKPKLPLRVLETVGEIEQRTKACLENRAFNDDIFNFWFDVEKATEIMRASAAESFSARAEYYESQPGLFQEWLEEVIDAPIRFVFSSRYKERIHSIQDELNTDLRAVLAGLAAVIAQDRCPSPLGAPLFEDPASDSSQPKVTAASADAKSMASTNHSSGFDFTTEARRISAISAYIVGWNRDFPDSSEASLARTARLDPADLSKWKKGYIATAALGIVSSKVTNLIVVLCPDSQLPPFLETRI